MITRGVCAAAVRALMRAEWEHWEEYAGTWHDLGHRWDGFQWNMVRHMVQDRLWDDLTYHLTHNLQGTHMQERILRLLWHSAPRLCQTLGLHDPIKRTDPSPTLEHNDSSTK